MLPASVFRVHQNKLLRPVFVQFLNAIAPYNTLPNFPTRTNLCQTASWEAGPRSQPGSEIVRRTRKSFKLLKWLFVDHPEVDTLA